MHFAPIALILLSSLSLVIAGSASLQGGSAASDVASRARKVANLAANARTQLNSFAGSDSGYTGPLEESASLLDSAKLHMAHVANHTHSDNPDTAARAPKVHASIAAHHAAKAAHLANEAHERLVSSDSRSGKKRPNRLLKAASHHLERAAQHTDRAMASQDLLDGNHETDATSFHND